MTEYIHQRPEWPHFRWDVNQLAIQLAAVRNHQGRLTGRMENLGFQLRAEAVLETLAEEVIKSNEIEGEFLNREEVRSSLARRLGMEIQGLHPADRHVDGVVEMMLDATLNFSSHLTEERLFAWHAAIFPTGRSGLRRIATGRWRDDDTGPMQVVSGPIGREKVHFEAPHASRISSEVKVFLSWFNAEPDTDPVIKAAVAHLWFITIHPFEDGNGRIARAIADMALARSEGVARRFYSMSAQIREERAQYYAILEKTQRGGLDITAWVEWFLTSLDKAFDKAETAFSSVLRKAKFWQKNAHQPFNERQRAMLNKLLDGFDGKLTSSKWATMMKTSQDTASRDIDDLICRQILFKAPAGGRSTSYVLTTSLAELIKVAADYTRKYSDRTAQEILPSQEPKARDAQQEAINLLATRLDRLAESSQKEAITYHHFENILNELHEQGFFLEAQLVSAIAACFQD
jgi:Fic family protein